MGRGAPPTWSTMEQSDAVRGQRPDSQPTRRPVRSSFRRRSRLRQEVPCRRSHAFLQYHAQEISRSATCAIVRCRFYRNGNETQAHSRSSSAGEIRVHPPSFRPRARALRHALAQPHRRERRLDHIRCAQVLPVCGREVEDCEERIGILLQGRPRTRAPLDSLRSARDGDARDAAKVGILGASTVAAGVGMIVLFWTLPAPGAGRRSFEP